jgi:SAM-dependent methyltransferase
MRAAAFAKRHGIGQTIAPRGSAIDVIARSGNRVVTREGLIRQHFNRDMRLIEIGPSYSPIVPKADGWQTTVVDHASQADIISKYESMGVATIDRIEPVDFVWQSGPLTSLIPAAAHGTFDGLLASHVGEHFPDLIAFLKSAAILVKPDGLLALALPDKRVCFDFFQPLTTTGDLVAAHAEGRIRHARRTFFNQAAYFTTRNGTVGWSHTGPDGKFQLPNPLSLAQRACEDTDESPTSEYRDSHAWAFTPKSFELLVLELNLLGHIDWAIKEIMPALGVEFYVWLEKRRIELPEPEVNPARLALLTAVMHEMKDAITQLDTADNPPPPPAPEPEPVDPAVEAMRQYDLSIQSGDRVAQSTARETLLQLSKQDGAIAPQLYTRALFAYKAALLRGDRQEISQALEEVAAVLSRIPHHRLRVQATLLLLRNPTVSRAAFAVRRIARPAMLWAFRA